MEQSTRDKTVYWDPYKKEYVTIDTSGWSGGEVLDFHRNLIYYVNSEGDYVYGMEPENRYYTSDDNSPEGTYWQEGTDPNPPNPDIITLPGMGEDGKQKSVNTKTGETNIKPADPAPPPPPPPTPDPTPTPDPAPDGGDDGATGGGDTPTGGDDSGNPDVPSGLTGPQIAALMEAISGVLPSVEPGAVEYTGNAREQNTATGYAKPTYAAPEQKLRLGPGDNEGLLDSIINKRKR